MEDAERREINRRLRKFGLVMVLVFVVLGFNLWRLQILKASDYAAKAKGNVMQLVKKEATRGDIQDRNGKVLVTSVPEFSLTLDWLDLQQSNNYNWKDVVHKLAEYVKPYWPNPNQNVEAIYEDMLVMIQNHQWERYRPVTILTDTSENMQSLRAVIAEHQDELPGVSVQAGPVRSYPQGSLAGQILGYVREISEQEITQFNQNADAQSQDFIYQQGDLVGKMGVEKSYDFWLRGTEGMEQVEVDNNARPISKNTIKPAQPGKTIQLTVDADLQATVEASLDEQIKTAQQSHPDAHAGAAVVIEVNTGKILAMASRPAMDPNDLIGTISEDTANKYFLTKEAASYNRALSGIYPPGSTFKMLTAMAALKAGVVTPDEAIDDKMSSLGPPEVQKQGFPEWGGNYFKMVNLYRGIALSSDIYFQVIGRRVFDAEPELVKQLANEFGLGVMSGVDLPGESKGVAPSAEWKKAYYTPTYQQMRDKKLEEIEARYATKISQAPDDKAKAKLVSDQEKEKKNVDVWYQQMVAQEIDWRLYDSFNNSIGQGYNTYTPLQLAEYVATIVNGGLRYQPYIVDKLIDPVSGQVVRETQPKVLNQVSVSPEILQVTKKAMSDVTSGEGTAAWLFADVPQFTGGGKTGTAQIGSKDTIAGDLYNGMFVAFAPYDNPQIAFAGVVEYGGHGGESAGYVAKAAFKQYFGWK